MRSRRAEFVHTIQISRNTDDKDINAFRRSQIFKRSDRVQIRHHVSTSVQSCHVKRRDWFDTNTNLRQLIVLIHHLLRNCHDSRCSSVANGCIITSIFYFEVAWIHPLYQFFYKVSWSRRSIQILLWKDFFL